jgi:hypothetical protein
MKYTQHLFFDILQDSEVTHKICPTLEKDMEKLVELYGEAALSYR